MQAIATNSVEHLIKEFGSTIPMGNGKLVSGNDTVFIKC